MHSHRITTSDDDADSESKKVGEAIVSWKPSLWKSQTNLVLRKSNPSGRIGGWIVSYFYWANFYPGSSWDCTLRIRMNGLKRWWRGWTRMPLVFSECRLMLIQSWIEASSLNICPIIQYDALEPPHILLAAASISGHLVIMNWGLFRYQVESRTEPCAFLQCAVQCPFWSVGSNLLSGHSDQRRPNSRRE